MSKVGIVSMSNNSRDSAPFDHCLELLTGRGLKPGADLGIRHFFKHFLRKAVGEYKRIQGPAGLRLAEDKQHHKTSDAAAHGHTKGAFTVQTLLTGVRFDLVNNWDQPYQKILGGGGGNRGFRNDQIPTGSSTTLFVEERLNLPWFKPAVDLGLTGFVDYSRGWAADIPFGQNTGSMTDVGGGLRIGFPAGTGAITHIEIGIPVGATGRGHQPVLRTYFARTQTNR